jgi:glucoamylase
MRTPPRRLRRWKVTAAIAATTSAALGVSAGAALGAPADAPGAPGAAATWTTGDKEGLGTSTTAQSKVWYTLTGGTMSEVYYPSGTTPNTRELQFAVTDGSTSTQLESDQTVQRAVSLIDPQSLTYRQTSTDQQGRWRLTKTYVTDPARPTVLLDVRFEALTPAPYQLFALYDPSLAGDSGNDSGTTSGPALLSSDAHGSAGAVASALVSSAPFSATTTGYVGTSDGRADLAANHTLSTTYAGRGPATSRRSAGSR